MKINMPRILEATLTIIFLLGLAQTAQPATETGTGTVTLKEPTAVNRVYLLNGDRISGTVISIDKDALFLDCMLSKKLRIDMRAVIAVYFQPKTQESFQPRKEEMDKIEFVNGDKITGDVLSLSGKTITIKGEYGDLILKKEGLSHIICGLREKIDLGFPKEEKNVVILKLVNGDTVSGKLLNFSDDVFHFTAKYSQNLKIKSQHVSSLTFTPRPEAGMPWRRNEGAGDGKWNYYYVSTPAGRLNGQVICGGLNKWKGAPLVSKKSDTYFLINGINRPAEGYYGLGTFLYSPTAIEYSIKTVANDFCALYIDGVLYSQWPIGTAYFTLRLTAGWHRVELALTNTDDPGYTLYWGTVENQAITSVTGVVIDSKKYDDWVSKIAGRN